MKLLALDGNSIINRAFYGIRLLTTKEGQFTNGIYGFINILLRLCEETSPDAVAVAFDLRAPTFRHEMYDQYKAGRKGMPDELAAQMPVLKELLSLMGYKILEREGFEADDILGTLAGLAKASGDFCYIATGDRDALQLIGSHCSVLLASTKGGRPDLSVYTPDEVLDQYGVTPPALIDVKALMGDPSDNIPGIAGIGQKTALKLIGEFGSLDNLYENISSPNIKETLRQKLIDGKESARLSRALGEINCAVPIPADLHEYIPKEYDRDKLAEMLTRLEFHNILKRLNLEAAAETSAEPAQEIKLEAVGDISAVIENIKSKKAVTFTADINNNLSGIVGISGNPVLLIENEEDIKAFLEEICANPDIAKRTHDCKPIFSAMLDCGLTPEGFVFDTALAGYLLNPSASGYDIPRLCAEYGAQRPELRELSADIDFIRDCGAMSVLCDKMSAKIEEFGQLSLLRDIEIPLALVLADMELVGFGADKDGLSKFGSSLELNIKSLETEICRQVGYEFNINSPKQLAEALFVTLGLPTGKKTKSGYSTNADVLEKLKGQHPVIELLLTYRQMSKLKSTYCDGLVKVIGGDGRIHSTFNQMETRTGRISSTEPNMQNIPVRTGLGRELRKFFTAREGYLLCDADYSQIELRVLADICASPVMVEAFKNDEDIHTITASGAFEIPTEMVTPEMRFKAKAVNFGIIYGIGPHSLAVDLGVSYGEAKQYIDAYFETYNGVREYMDAVVSKAKSDGFAFTAFGRRRYLPELTSSNGNLRAFGERVARNMPIQGTAADIIKIAMIKVWRRLRAEMPQARLILQVHDELIVEAPAADAESVCEMLSFEMENAAKLAVPLKAECKTGKTWYEAK